MKGDNSSLLGRRVLRVYEKESLDEACRTLHPRNLLELTISAELASLGSLWTVTTPERKFTVHR